uniref:Protein RMD5 homolog A-like n=1 Tax=Ananas comosus var. bracteatus TaxID=296719 RepID=A0A6V7QF79_ANACO|nr:unnamed protein product [Ananas comosus var. bracteatus]
MAPVNQLEAYYKEINVLLVKYIKLLEKTFNPDISKAYRNVDFDTHIINEIIAAHFYRQGLFDLGDCFVNESNESQAASLKSQFQEMYSILEAMKSSKSLESAINWATKNSEQLSQDGSILELKLHRLQFIEILKREGSRDVALKYARRYLARFASVHKIEIQKLMACLLWAGRLDQSPYSNLISTAHWDNLSKEFTLQFCSRLGQSCENPLSVVIDAGVQALPTLLKMAMVMASKKHEWDNLKQLPVPVELHREFQFHSVFVCPVLREQGSDENPPMLIPCGHVLSKQSIVKLSKSGTRMFKCPYCPAEAAVSQCRQIHF